MAQKAKKDRARANVAALNSLHVGSAIVHVVFLASHFLLWPRSLVAYGLFSTPGLVCEYVLEKSGRPTYEKDTGSLKTSGEDMAAPGLTEYMFDVIWVTWFTVLAVVFFGNWAWLLWAVVPAYGIYLGSGLLGMGKQKMAEMQGGGDSAVPQGNRRARRAA